jgi:hypothetical protein
MVCSDEYRRSTESEKEFPKFHWARFKKKKARPGITERARIAKVLGLLRPST